MPLDPVALWAVLGITVWAIGFLMSAPSTIGFRCLGISVEGAAVTCGTAVTVGSEEKVSVVGLVVAGCFGLDSELALATFAFSSTDCCSLVFDFTFFNSASGLAAEGCSKGTTGASKEEKDLKFSFSV